MLRGAKVLAQGVVMGRKGSLQIFLQFAVFAAVMLVFVSPASAIPAFARKYSLRCTACHEAWPVLNDFGLSFRDNGYQLRVSRDDTVTADPRHRPVSLTDSYLLYSYHPGVPGGSNLSAYDMGENQKGVEFLGHDQTDLTRYSISVFSAQDSLGSRNALSSPSYYGHFQKFFRFKDGPVSEAEVGVWGVQANYPTQFLTSGGAPIPGSGSNLQASTRYGIEANVWIGPTVAPLHLDVVYGHGTDKKELLLTADGVTPADRAGTWNGGFFEALLVPPADLPHC